MAMPPASHDHNVVPFRAIHLAGIRWPEEEYVRLMGQQAVEIYERNPAWTGTCNGRFVAAAGIVVPYRGLGEAWAIAGPLVHSHRTFFHRTIKAGILGIAQALGIRRLQVTVRADFTVSHEWVQRLGFTFEARLAKYGVKGEDMNLYVRFFGE